MITHWYSFDLSAAILFHLLGAGLFLSWQLEFFLAFRKRWWPGLIVPLLMLVPCLYILMTESSPDSFSEDLVFTGMFWSLYLLPYFPCRLLRFIVDKIKAQKQKRRNES